MILVSSTVCPRNTSMPSSGSPLMLATLIPLLFSFSSNAYCEYDVKIRTLWPFCLRKSMRSSSMLYFPFPVSLPSVKEVSRTFLMDLYVFEICTLFIFLLSLKFSVIIFFVSNSCSFVIGHLIVTSRSGPLNAGSLYVRDSIIASRAILSFIVSLSMAKTRSLFMHFAICLINFVAFPLMLISMKVTFPVSSKISKSFLSFSLKPTSIIFVFFDPTNNSGFFRTNADVQIATVPLFREISDISSSSERTW